jgi:hypothetical protein
MEAAGVLQGAHCGIRITDEIGDVLTNPQQHGW